MSASDIRRVLDAGPARRAAVDGELWFLDSSPWLHLVLELKGIEQTKQAVLDAAWQLPLPLFLLPELPLDVELMPFVEETGGAWLINRARPASQFYAAQPASGLGNWRLYAAEQPVTAAAPDAFRNTPQELVTYLKDQRIVLWIDCFHDNTDWCVALRDPAPPAK